MPYEEQGNVKNRFDKKIMEYLIACHSKGHPFIPNYMFTPTTRWQSHIDEIMEVLRVRACVLSIGMYVFTFSCSIIVFVYTALPASLT